MTRADDLILRRLRARDAPAVCTLLREVPELTPLAGDAWRVDELRAWFLSDVDCCVGAFRGRILVGVCLVHYHEAVHKIHVEDIYVTEDSRRAGIGSLVLRASLQQSPPTTSPIRVVALVSDKNVSGLDFFRSNGFTTGASMAWMQR